MNALLIAIGVLVAYLIAYHTYGRWLARRLFKLDPDAVVPSAELNDDRDYVPTRRAVVFGHHFTSIAGTGPIVGPAIAIMWGWLPALIWVLLGSIFIGAVHDFGALVVSLRNRGQTVGDIAGRVLNRRVRLLFLFVLFMTLTIVLAIFGLVIAAVFRQYPSSIFPCLVQIPLAVLIGLWLHRKGMGLVIPSLIALAIMYLSVIFGDWGPLHAFNAALAGWSNFTWVVVLLAYSYVASVLPVWLLLQPRDFINSLQLLTALGLILLGLVVAALIGGAPPAEGAARPELALAAPVAQWAPRGAPVIFPFLFVTVACGAISGFHCLVSSGTSSKQLRREPDAQFVGYGSMLTEGFLATLVILACAAGLGLGLAGPEGGVLTGQEAWASRYGSWVAAGGLGSKIAAFVDGAANFLRAAGMSGTVAAALMGVLVASFAGTTLDTACRLQRYVIQELASTFSSRSARRGVPAEADASAEVSAPREAHALNPLGWLRNKHASTIFGVVVAGLLASLAAPGQAWTWQTAGSGGLILWPMFGATNQLLGGLAFLVIGFWLWRRRLPVWFIVAPMVFMLLMPAWAMIWQLFVSNAGDRPGWFFQETPNWALVVVALATLALEAWMIVEAIILWPNVRGRLEAALPPLQTRPIPPLGRSIT
ncbi:MAG: carbon starvation protein A [Planctomycetota bacterium]|nr:carbon starvation protein A [Planctomycetota bacterium]